MGMRRCSGCAPSARCRSIVISARDREGEKIRALDFGADDYVEKPFALGELLARLRACLRRGLAQEGAAEIWRSHGWSRWIWCGGGCGRRGGS